DEHSAISPSLTEHVDFRRGEQGLHVEVAAQRSLGAIHVAVRPIYDKRVTTSTWSQQAGDGRARGSREGSDLDRHACSTGAGCVNRTRDLPLTRRLLYP
ncbi:MAG: hypothetical protein ACK5RJ_08920, partial [Burkholderiales bacterium]